MSTEQKRALVSPEFKKMSIIKQCDILGLARSNYYYRPKGESVLNQILMKAIDKEFLEHPFLGVERMTVYLRNLGYRVNEKRVRRLYRLMGIETIYPKKNLSKRDPEKYVYPYLLKGLDVVRPNQVWQADITYIPMQRGFMYMFAIIDVYSRRIMGWSISNSMSVEWCINVVEAALKEYGKPDIFNTDQGSQFTSKKFIALLTNNEIKISMDSKGRALDDIFIERFWRTIKYEHIYLCPANGGIDLLQGLKIYMRYYNEERTHKNIGKITPKEKYESFKEVS